MAEILEFRVDESHMPKQLHSTVLMGCMLRKYGIVSSNDRIRSISWTHSSELDLYDFTVEVDVDFYGT